MVAVFLTFALSGPLAPKEMGIILAVAVLLDALWIRLIVLPVVLRLTGHAAWHTPRWLAKILPEVRFSHSRRRPIGPERSKERRSARDRLRHEYRTCHRHRRGPREVEAALAEQGFGVLTEIDVAATLKNKIGKDIAPQVILGACNPVLADRALTAESSIGLLLPCNVVLRSPGERRTIVEALDPP